MDYCLPDWSTEVAPDFPHPVQRKPFGSDNDLVELLWQNGELVLHNQTNRKQTYDPSKPKQLLHQQTDQINPNNLIQDYDTSSWIDCPIDESFEKEFCADFLSEIPPFDPVETTNKPSKKPERSVISTSDVNQFAPPPLPPPPRFQTPAVNRQGECSVMTVGSSHCASNQVDLSWANSSSRTMSETYAPRVDERRTREQPMTSCSGGSASSMWKTSSQSNDTNRHKRKSRDHMEESDSPSDATEMESAAGNKTSQKSGGSRKSRVAEVHNMSERRRRDRINEKMRALQELIPHSNKSDKASMLDEAIEYMKSLQLQIQLMWMGRGMAPMMIPGMQHYMSRIGMGIAPPMVPTAIQNLMRLSRLPIMNQAMSTVAPTTNQTPVGHSPVMNPVNYQDHMQNSSFHEQYANYMGFHSVPNDSQQTNMFNFGLHSAPQSNGNGSIR